MKSMLHHHVERIRIWFIYCLMASAVTSVSAQQANCGFETIKKAEDHYVIGKFEKVQTELKTCLNLDAFTVAQKLKAFRLISLSFLAQDNLDSAKLYVSKLLSIEPNYVIDKSIDPIYFGYLVEDGKKIINNQISSVSKREEDIRKAPATALVLDFKTARQRGYTDLIQMLQDMPGFDISKSSGDNTYASFYQRGYRSFNNDRTMFLIDGIEFSYIWSNNIFLSRQFPMSAFKRLEVIQGPASTLYGTNAYCGVLNFTSMKPGDIIAPGHDFGVLGNLSAGSFKTMAADVSVALEKENVSFILTARYFQSDEWDRSMFADWDFKPSTHTYYTDSLVYYTTPSIVLGDSLLMAGHPYFTLSQDSTEIYLTDAGATAARALDSASFEQPVNGALPRYTDLSRSYFLHGRLKFSAFTLGFDYYNLQEADIGSVKDKVAAGSDNGSLWGPVDLMVFTRYEKPVSEKTSLTNLTTWRLSELNNKTVAVAPYDYENTILSYRELVYGVQPGWISTYFYQVSTQIRNETRFFSSLGKRWEIFSGIEERFMLGQGNYLQSNVPLPIDSGTVASVLGGNHYRSFDVGVFSQAQFRISSLWKLVFGSRLDYHKLRSALPSRLDFTPRLVAVYSPGSWVFKLIYSEAFKAPSNFERYSTATFVRDLPNPNLKPEQVYNWELSAGYDFKRLLKDKDLSLILDGDFYYSLYDNVIETQTIDKNYADNKDTLQNINAGKYRITGNQITAEFSHRKLGSVSFNYSYTNAFGLPIDEFGNPLKELDETTGDSIVVSRQQVADIAPHKFNLIVNAILPAGFNLNTRLNYSAARPVGEGTTVPANTTPGGKINSFLIVNSVLGWTSPKREVMLQLVCNNVFNSLYFVPGVRTGGGFYASRIPQPRRNFMINLWVRF
jgi:outer membrane receptor for ferrienterochelin and colicins